MTMRIDHTRAVQQEPAADPRTHLVCVCSHRDAECARKSKVGELEVVVFID